jgi:hypothetical protein
MGGAVTITVTEVEAFEEGSIGWGVAKPVIALPDGRSVSPRWSAVFRREDGTWKAVQVHASVGVPNDDVFG